VGSLRKRTAHLDDFRELRIGHHEQLEKELSIELVVAHVFAAISGRSLLLSKPFVEFCQGCHANGFLGRSGIRCLLLLSTARCHLTQST
jgi:hypothetical protein